MLTTKSRGINVRLLRKIQRRILNQIRKYTFDEIADFIEQHVEVTQ